MKLVSSFKDFYDILAGVDTDPTPLFVRETQPIPVRHNDKQAHADLEPFWSWATAATAPGLAGWDDRGPWAVYVDHVWLAFCGKGYHFYKFLDRLYRLPSELEAAMRAADARDLMSQHHSEFKTFGAMWDNIHKRAAEKTLLNKRYNAATRQWSHLEPPTDEGYERWGKGVIDLPAELFRKVNAPYFVLGRRWPNHVTHMDARVRDAFAARYPDFGLDKHYINYYSVAHEFDFVTLLPDLKALGLHRLWDPYETWQAVEGYLGNEMARQFDPASARTDELARDYHGFDEWSFKNRAPGERKARRRENKERKRGAA